jgi:DNA polymerase-3 subunit delta'
MKYNWSIIGHEKQLQQIEKDIESGNLSHAYLLVGSNSIGKHTVAKKLAGILQCENNFCHECATCIQVQKGSHLDTFELNDDGEAIKIEAVRGLIDRLSMTRQAQYKIVLIQSMERMTVEASNSFLKILEEPPTRTIFILTTNDIRLLLPTIVSRVRVLKFNPVSASYLTKKLHELYPDHNEEDIKQVSLFSLGRTGKAIHLMENPDALADYIKVYHDVQNFLDHKNIVDRFAYVESLSANPGKFSADSDKIDSFFNILKHVLRSKVLEGDPKSAKYINTLSKIDEAGILLKKNINPRLVLENLMLAL